MWIAGISWQFDSFVKRKPIHAIKSSCCCIHLTGTWLFYFLPSSPSRLLFLCRWFVLHRAMNSRAPVRANERTNERAPANVSAPVFPPNHLNEKKKRSKELQLQLLQQQLKGHLLLLGCLLFFSSCSVL